MPDPSIDGDSLIPFPLLSGVLALTPLVPDHDRLVRVGRDLIEAIGEDPDRPGLLGTPERFARAWAELVMPDQDARASTFAEGITDQVVLMDPIVLWGICEHHLMPFRLEVSIGYQPQGELIGLSKIPRLARLAAARPGLQEKIVDAIAAGVRAMGMTQDVAILARGFHTCMALRGPRSDASTTNLLLSGAFEQEPLRSTFLKMSSLLM